jgi:hypothetical protein
LPGGGRVLQAEGAEGPGQRIATLVVGSCRAPKSAASGRKAREQMRLAMEPSRPWSKAMAGSMAAR